MVPDLSFCILCIVRRSRRRSHPSLLGTTWFGETSDEEPSLIFSGYIHGNTNLVGKWRETATPVDLPGWEGVWSMTKIE
jgi:hypothetical protein